SPPPPLAVAEPVLAPPPPPPLSSSSPHAATPKASAPTQPATAMKRSLTYSLQSGEADVRRHSTPLDGRTAIDNRSETYAKRLDGQRTGSSRSISSPSSVGRQRARRGSGWSSARYASTTARRSLPRGPAASIARRTRRIASNPYAAH